VVSAVILSFIREFSERKLNLSRTYFNPAQIFILSFLIIILLGSLLLMLPKATHNGISFIDALFTSTSAVCVSGLIVVDTGTYFTLFGQSIILFLIQIEVFRREIADISVKRAFATISLSLMVIGLGIMLITIFDPEKGLLNIAFECFSAYSTVGLSLGITAGLSTASKLVVVAIMFVGRVSMLSIIVAVFRKIKHTNYRDPSEEITIN